LGGRSFAARGLIGTPLEDVLPVELGDRRRAGVVRAALDVTDVTRENKLALTPDGEAHPAMRVGATPEETLKLSSALAPLAALAPVAATVAESAGPDDLLTVTVDARDGAFLPVADATADAAVTAPGGERRSLALRRSDAGGGRFSAAFRPTQPGLYRVSTDAR